MLQNHLKFSSSDFSLPRICKFPGIAKFGVYKYPALLLLLFKKKMHKFFSLCKILIHCIFSFVDTGFTVFFLILKLEISLVVICNLHLLHLKLQSLMCSIFIKWGFENEICRILLELMTSSPFLGLALPWYALLCDTHPLWSKTLVMKIFLLRFWPLILSRNL